MERITNKTSARRWPLRAAAGLTGWLGIALLVAACEPTVRVTAPDKPIILQIDLNIKQEVQLRVERDIANVSASPAIPLAKKAGWIGERLDGYLGLVRDDAPPEIGDLALKANEARREKYEGIAKKNNIQRQVVERMAGKQFVSKVAPGEYAMGNKGEWVRR